MLAAIATHCIAPGMRAEAERAIAAFTDLARVQPGFVSRQACQPGNAPGLVVTITTWRSIQDFDAFERMRLSRHAAEPTSPLPWAKPVKRDLFDVFHTAVPPQSPAPARLTMVTDHFAGTHHRETGLKRLMANTDIALKTPGLVQRQIMVSREDPTRLTTATAWTSEVGYTTWLEAVKQVAAREPPIWSRPVESAAYAVTGWT